MLSHRAARAILEAQFRSLFGREGTGSELMAAQAVALHETQYGAGWKPPGAGSHNWGAITDPTPDALSFTYADAGADGPYTTFFKGYVDDAAGARDVLQVMYKGQKAVAAGTLVAATRGDADGVARAMRRAGYFWGVPVGAPEETRIENYRRAIVSKSETIAQSLVVPNPFGSGPIGPETPGSSSGFGRNALAIALIGLGALAWTVGKRKA